MKLQPARGTRDIFGKEARRMAHVVQTFKRIGVTHGFEELSTPIFEFTDVFKRPLGEASDIVSKEMYTFQDRGGEDITLRPEFTAGVCRAFISNGMTQNLPCRFMSHGPAFRYERPQKGRYRQFHQLNAELLGPDTPEFDVDMIAFAAHILSDLGLSQRVTLNINTLGDGESRALYRENLVDYFKSHKNSLSDDSKERLTKNPLRILDSKSKDDQAIIAGAPKLSDHLNEKSCDFFARVKAGLDASSIAYTHNERLVRGMDYYNHTAFEFITTDLGAQGTVIGGGRYDGLIKQLGGTPTAGVGFAGGIERLAMLLTETPKAKRLTVLMPMGDAAMLVGFKVAENLRRAGIAVATDRSGNLTKRLNRASKKGASHVVIIGDNEITAQTAQVKTLDTGDQQDIAISRVADHIKFTSTGENP